MKRQRHLVGEGIGPSGDIGFDGMGQGVDGGVGGQTLGLGQGQFVVHQRRQRLIGDAHAQHLLVRRLVGDDGDARRFVQVGISQDAEILAGR